MNHWVNLFCRVFARLTRQGAHVRGIIQFVAFFVMVNGNAHAIPSFVEVDPGIGIAWAGSVDWGDYNKDSYPDLLITACSDFSSCTTTVSKVFRNLGDGTFQEIALGLPGVARGVGRWVDINNDANLDIFLSGCTSAACTSDSSLFVTKIFRQVGSTGQFVEVTGHGLPPAGNCSAEFADIDKDNYPDLLIAGETTSFVPMLRVYRNLRNMTFSQLPLGLSGLNSIPSVAWGDYDNDSYPDFVAAGYDGSGPVSRIYRNNHSLGFTVNSQASLVGVSASSVAWGDYDRDGDLDLLVSGTGDSGVYTKLYRNNGNGSFTETTGHGLPPLAFSSAAWKDYNRDGYDDLLLTGGTGVAPYSYASRLYRNLRNGTFEDANLGLAGVSSARIGWTDFDLDLFPDFAIIGSVQTGGYLATVYRNILGDSLPKISGRITASGNGVPNIVLVLDGASMFSTVTNGNGEYLFNGVADGSYSITPQIDQYNFSPTSRNVTVTGNDVPNQDFEAVAKTATPTPTPPPALPDLQVSKLSFPRRVKVGVKYRMTVDIINAGTTPSGGFRAGLYLKASKAKKSRLFASWNEKGLAVGATTSKKLLKTFPKWVKRGAYNLEARLDITNRVVETEESNNLYVAPKNLKVL